METVIAQEGRADLCFLVEVINIAERVIIVLDQVHRQRPLNGFAVAAAVEIQTLLVNRHIHQCLKQVDLLQQLLLDQSMAIGTQQRCGYQVRA